MKQPGAGLGKLWISALLATVAATVAALAAGCGEGVHLGSGNNSQHESRPLTLKSADYKLTTNAGLAPNPLPPNPNIPMAGFGQYSAGEFLAITNVSNSTPVYHDVFGVNSYFLGHYCFDVSGIDVSRYTRIRITGAATAGYGPIGGPPTSTGMTVGLWNHITAAYDTSIVSTNTVNMAPFTLTNSASMRPADAVHATTGGTTGCIFVTILSQFPSDGSAGYSIAGIQTLSAFLEN